MEWLRTILCENADADSLMLKISKELPKHTVPKDVYASLRAKLDDANGKLLELSKNDFEGLQKTLQDERRERLSEKRAAAFKEAFSGDYATDVDYLLFKLSDRAVYSDDGALQNGEELVAIAKKEHPKLFGTALTGVRPFAGGESAPEVTEGQFRKMGYFERAELLSNNPELYQKLTGGK